jgi:hypothetical protein
MTAGRRLLPGPLVALCLAAVAAMVRGETLRPLVTEDLSTLGDRELEIQLAVDVATDWPSPVAPVEGRLVRAPVLGLNFGLGERTELQLRLPLRQWYSPRGLDTSSATGDPTIATKVRFFGGRGVLPGLGGRVQVTLPMVDAGTLIATHETDVRLELLAGLDLGGALVAINAGYALLGDPDAAGRQDRKVVLGAGLFLPLGLLDVGADLHGQLWGEGRPDEWTAIAGVARQVGPLRLDAGAGMGSRDARRSFRFTAGAGWVLSLGRHDLRAGSRPGRRRPLA